MAPIKIEENIREKLQERELQPSQNAWSKLEDKLGDSVETKNNRVVWYAIAASIIGIIVVSSLLFNSKTSPIQENELVIQDEIENPGLFDEQISNSEEEQGSELVVEDIITEKQESNNSSNKENSENGKLAEPNKITSISKTNESVATNQPIKSEKKLESIVEKKDIIETPFIDNKVEEVVAKVENLKKTKQEISPAEIDALLAEAQREIKNQRILNNTTGRVDATALLLDVELELERSFRDKVFDALGDGYHIIRTAVSERNN